MFKLEIVSKVYLSKRWQCVCTRWRSKCSLVAEIPSLVTRPELEVSTASVRCYGSELQVEECAQFFSWAQGQWHHKYRRWGIPYSEYFSRVLIFTVFAVVIQARKSKLRNASKNGWFHEFKFCNGRNPRIISAIQFRALPQKFYPAKNTCYMVFRIKKVSIFYFRIELFRNPILLQK